jgi:predicted Zn finger-like uncharacterized protein
MLVECPVCQRRYQLTPVQIREQGGIVTCEQCNTLFDALPLMQENTASEPVIAQATTELHEDIAVVELPPAERVLVLAEEQVMVIEQIITHEALLPAEAVINATPVEKISAPEKTPEQIATSASTKPVVLPWEKQNEKVSPYWTLALVANIVILIGQYFYFEGRNLSQNPKLRPQLENVASALHRSLPIYQNAEELTVLNSSFEKQLNHSRLLSVSIMNQADFSQAYPKIKLTLFDESGNAFSHRLFQPSDYLAPVLVNTTLLADNNSEIHLMLAEPKTDVGGYTIDLLY